MNTVGEALSYCTPWPACSGSGGICFRAKSSNRSSISLHMQLAKPEA